jgi:hypothetical protein
MTNFLDSSRKCPAYFQVAGRQNVDRDEESGHQSNEEHNEGRDSWDSEEKIEWNDRDEGGGDDEIISPMSYVVSIFFLSGSTNDNGPHQQTRGNNTSSRIDRENLPLDNDGTQYFRRISVICINDAIRYAPGFEPNKIVINLTVKCIGQ